MTQLEKEAAAAVEAACLAIEAAQAICLQAGCDGYAVVDGLRQALEQLDYVYRVLKGKA